MLIGASENKTKLTEISKKELRIFSGGLLDVMTKILPIVKATVDSIADINELKGADAVEIFDAVYENFHSVDSLPAMIGVKILKELRNHKISFRSKSNPRIKRFVAKLC